MKGMDSLLKRLEDLSTIHVKQAIETVENDVVKAIKQGASFAPKASKCVGKCKVRQGKHYYYMDIGLSTDVASFDEYKSAYFHNYGYNDKGLNFGDKGPYLDMHKQWFDSAVNTISPQVKKKIKSILEANIRKGCK